MCTQKTFTIYLVTDLNCYFCNSQDEEHSECNAEEAGELVNCQMSDSKDPHYGNACIVGHTGKVTPWFKKDYWNENLANLIIDKIRISFISS